MGVAVIEIDESYTSAASFLHNDPMPSIAARVTGKHNERPGGAAKPRKAKKADAQATPIVVKPLTAEEDAQIAKEMPLLKVGLRPLEKAKRDAAALAKAEKEAKDRLASLAAKKARAEKKQAAQAAKATEKFDPASVSSIVSVSSKTDLATTESAEQAKEAEEKAGTQQEASSTENSGAQAAPAPSPKDVKFSGRRGDSSRLKAAKDPEAKSRDWLCLDSNP